MLPFDVGEDGSRSRVNHGRAEFRRVGGRQRSLEGGQDGFSIGGGHGVEDAVL